MTKGNGSHNRVTNLGLSDRSLHSAYAYRLCMELGDNRCRRPAYGGGLSPHRSPTSDLHVSECPWIGHCLALGAIGRSDYNCFPAGSAFVASAS